MASYARVPSSEPVELNDVSLDSGMAGQPEAGASAPAAGATRRTTTHRVELRTPRLAGESDEAYKRRIQVAWMGAMIHTIGWVAAALAILYYTDMWNVLRYDTRINRTFLLLAVLFGFVLSLVIAYLAVWVPMRSTRPILDLSAHAPTAIPIGAGAGVATFTCFLIAVWPIWGFVTIPIVIVLAMASCLGPNLLPF